MLLISPESQKILDKYEFRNNPYIGGKTFITPVQIATIAALTPDTIEVDLWDENVHGAIDDATVFDKQYDLVGVTGYISHIQRAKKISGIFQKQRIPVAVGGAGVSSNPEQYRNNFDILFIGEAELTWPLFISDFLSGSYHKEYREDAFPDMGLSPSPRWDSIARLMKNSYLMGGVQTARGCPFSCDFCRVWKVFGRQVRLKPIDNVLDEVAALEGFGIERILICSDNFAGNPRYLKELLRKLIELNNSFSKPLHFSAEISINIAHDEELLSLLADANFTFLFIGIESPNKNSLKETNKIQNLRGDLVADCKKILFYGMSIRGSMIVGFDNDTKEIFDLQFEFLQTACIPIPVMHMLQALPGTELWNRLVKERRVLDLQLLYDVNDDHYFDSAFITNIIPKRMTRIDLFSNYINLLEKILDWENFALRVMGFVSNVRKKNNYHISAEPSDRLPPKLDDLFTLDEKRSINKILSHTQQHAPYMMDKAIELIINHHICVSQLPFLRKNILKQIRHEKCLDIEQFILNPNSRAFTACCGLISGPKQRSATLPT